VAGFGSAKCSNEEAYIFQKLIRTGFGHNNVDHCTGSAMPRPWRRSWKTSAPARSRRPFNEIEECRRGIVIGANPTENHPVAATYFKQFAKRGGKLIVMDPRGRAMKRYASHMLQFRPGTDVSMLNAIMHVIVEEKALRRAIHPGFTEKASRLERST
jgi:formate dehydrogenase major subunit